MEQDNKTTGCQKWDAVFSDLSFDIILNKYLLPGETFQQWEDRVCGDDGEFRRLFEEQKFIPAGRILANRGLPARGVKTTMSNCYVLSVEDSIESIYKTCAEMARTYSYGGGVGVDLSRLRPRGSVVNNSARTTTGAVSFMQTFDLVTGTIGQNGRRGALMLSIDVRHPDLDEFVSVKANTDAITNANISVRVCGGFMEAVKNKEPFVLRWPCDAPCSPDPSEYAVDDGVLRPFAYDEDGVEKTGYYKVVDAERVFMDMCRNNWDYGEPGILFWDRISGYHMMSESRGFSYAGVNPCLTGDTLVTTDKGEVRLDEVVAMHQRGESVKVASYNIDSGIVEYKEVYDGLLTKKNANVIIVEAEDGTTLRLTPDHKVYTENRGWVEAANLVSTDVIVKI